MSLSNLQKLLTVFLVTSFALNFMSSIALSKTPSGEAVKNPLDPIFIAILVTSILAVVLAVVLYYTFRRSRGKGLGKKTIDSEK